MQSQLSTSAHQKRVGKILKLVLVATLFVMSNSFGQTVSFSPSATSIHIGDTLTLTNTSLGFSGSTVFKWNYGLPCAIGTDGNPLYGDTCNVTITGLSSQHYVYSVAGNFKLTLKTFSGGVWLIKESIINVAPSPPIGCTNASCNLIQNPSFEFIRSCPPNTHDFLGGGSVGVLPPSISCSWEYSTWGSPDLSLNYNSGGCTFNFVGVGTGTNTITGGCRNGNTGNGCAGFWTYGSNYREYIYQELPHNLIAGVTYHLEFYAALAEYCKLGTKMQVVFTNDIFTDYTVTADLTPPADALVLTTSAVLVNNKHTDPFVKYEFDFTPTSNCYNYITFGNFNSDANTPTQGLTTLGYCSNAPLDQTYILVDDVSLFPLSGIELVTDQPCANINGNIAVEQVCNASLTFPYTYLWSNGATTQNLNGIPANTYTVTVTGANAATATQSVTLIKVDADISGDTYNPCDNSTLTYSVKNGASGESYVWSIVGGTIAGTPPYNSTSVVVTWTASGGTLTLTTTRNCCTVIKSVFVPACCTSTYVFNNRGITDAITNHLADYTDIVDLTSVSTATYQIGGTAATNPNPSFVINGVLTIDHDLTITTAFISLSADAKIIVKDGAHLFLDRCILTACSGRLWDGIIIANPTGSTTGPLRLDMQACNIYNAKRAVYSTNGGSFYLLNSYFNRNYESVVFDDFGSAHPGIIESCNFRCTTTDIVTTPATLLASNTTAAGIRSFSGVRGKNNYYITINPINIFNTNYGNYFCNLDYGIYLRDCNGFLKNNAFENINSPLNNSSSTNTPVSNSIGSAIYNIDVDGLPNLVDVFGETSIIPFSMKNCKRAVFNDGDVYSTIYGCKFEKMTLAAIELKNINSGQAYIQGNVFTTCTKGVYCNNPAANSYIDIQQSTYTFNTGVLPTATGGNISAYSTVKFVDVLCATTTPLNLWVSNNTQIENAETAIAFTNVICDYATNGSSVYGNYIKFPQNDTPEKDRYGIQFKNCTQAVAESNYIEWAGGNPKPTNSKGRKINGISLESGEHCSAINNTLQYCGKGLTSLNCTNAFSTTFACNSMYQNYRGVVLDNTLIGNQGTTTQPQDNEWDNGWAGRDKDVYGANMPTTVPVWYDRSAAYPFHPSLTWISPTAATFTTIASPPASVCAYPITPPAMRQAELSSIIKEENAFYNLPDETQYEQKRYAYEQIVNDATLTTLGTANDAVLLAYRDSVAQTDMGALVQVNTNVQQANITTAAVANTIVLPQNTSEENQKTLNQIYLVTWAVGIFDFTVEQTATLENIAYQDPYYGGAAAVYGAQAMLGIDIPYGSDNSSNRLIQTAEQQALDSKFLLSPQPSTDFAALLNLYLAEGDNCLIELYDITGRQLATQQFANMEYPIKINLKNFTAGVYGYKIYINAIPVNSGKLTVK